MNDFKRLLVLLILPIILQAQSENYEQFDGKACTVATNINNVFDCTEAGKAFGMLNILTVEYVSGFPMGCYEQHNVLYFNMKKDSISNDPYAKPICKKLTTSEFFIATGSCDIEGNCVSSRNYPGPYGNGESCSIKMSQDASVIVRSPFILEKCCDTLVIRKVDVESASAVPENLKSGEILWWTTDGNETREGWQLCFHEYNNDWSQIGSDIDGEAAGDYSGRSVAISSDGSTVAVGAYRNDGNGANSGHVRVFRFNGNDWSQIGSDIDGEAAGDNSGILVTISSDGTTVAVGAIGNDGNGANSGHVRVFRFNGNDWSQIGSDIDGEAAGDASGNSVTISSDGSTVAVGAVGNDVNGANSGHVRVFRFNGNDWSQIGSDIDGEAADDNSGNSVTISSDGKTVAVGAYINNGNGALSGHVRVFRFNGNDWSQIGSDIDGEAAYDHSGYSVTISSDGSTVAVGAVGNDVNGALSGHVRVFRFNGNDWSQIGSDIDGEAAGDNSGYSVTISSDGTTVAVGAIGNDVNGANSGHVRVFTIGGHSFSLP